ncbi:MAG: AraC family transcriptional regulator, partial [Bacteroidota bacterium]
DFFSDKLFPYRLQYFYNRSVPPIFNPQERLFSFKHDIMEEIAQELENVQTDSIHLLRSILYYMLIKLNRAYCTFHGLEPDTELNNYAFQFKRLLEEKVREEQRVDFYTEELGLSRVSLNKAVKEQFGITLTKMIKDRLVYEIKSELLYSTQSVAEIAFDLHFSEANNLTRFFKRCTGKTPRDFRAAYQNDSYVA